MSELFITLADVYQSGGLAEYSAHVTPGLLNRIYELDWMGGSVLDIGCGTGEAATYLGTRNLNALGIDSSASMLQYAEHLAEQKHANTRFVQADLRTYIPEIQYELVLSLGVMNYMLNQEDLTAFFQTAAKATASNKFFIFDLRTILGLSRVTPTRVVADGERVFITAQSAFSHETLSLATRYTIFNRQTGWIRSEENHVLRGYPLQLVERKLSQTGFLVNSYLAPSLDYTETPHECDNLIIIAQRREA